MQRTTSLIALTALAGTVLAGASPASAAPADDKLIRVEPGVAVIDAPAPGHSTDWEIDVENISNAEVSLGLLIEGTSRSRLFTGANPLLIDIEGSDGTVLADDVPAAELVGTTLALPALAAGETYSLSGTALLPRDAGNEYQGETGILTFSYTAIDGQGGGTKPNPEDPTDPEEPGGPGGGGDGDGNGNGGGNGGGNGNGGGDGNGNGNGNGAGNGNGNGSGNGTGLGDFLAVTGANGGLALAGGALIALTAGTAVLVVARRRRIGGVEL